MDPAVARSYTNKSPSREAMLLSCTAWALEYSPSLRVSVPITGGSDGMQALQQQQSTILKERASEGRPAVQISAAAGTIASAQDSHTRTPQDMDQGKGDVASPATAQQHPSAALDGTAQPESMRDEQACTHPGSAIITVQRAVIAPGGDTDAVSCSSSPDSIDSLQVLKPLTPAQSSEHSPGSSTQEQHAGAASSPAAAEAPRLSCEVCNISTTSAELLQQHLQGRRHLKVLAVQTLTADAEGRCEPAHLSCTPQQPVCRAHAWYQTRRFKHPQACESISDRSLRDVRALWCWSQARKAMHASSVVMHAETVCALMFSSLPCRPAMEYPCDVCNVVAASEGDLAAHLDGKRHRKHIQMAEVLADSKSPAAPAPAADLAQLHCNLCDVTAPTQTHKELHLM